MTTSIQQNPGAFAKRIDKLISYLAESVREKVPKKSMRTCKLKLDEKLDLAADVTTQSCEGPASFEALEWTRHEFQFDMLVWCQPIARGEAFIQSTCVEDKLRDNFILGLLKYCGVRAPG